jgi:hypothetical protein
MKKTLGRFLLFLTLTGSAVVCYLNFVSFPFFSTRNYSPYSTALFGGRPRLRGCFWRDT